MNSATMEGLAWYYFLLVSLNLGACAFMYYRLRKPTWAAVWLIFPALFAVLCALNAMEASGAYWVGRSDLDGDGRINVNEYVASEDSGMRRTLAALQVNLSKDDRDAL